MNTFLEYYSRKDKRINFHFIPLAHLDSSNLKSTTATTIERYKDSKSVSIVNFEINGKKINVGGLYNGVGLSLREGSYLIRVTCYIDYRFIPSSNISFEDKKINKAIDREAIVEVSSSGDCYLVFLASAYTNWGFTKSHKSENALLADYSNYTYGCDTVNYVEHKYKLVNLKERYDFFVTSANGVNRICRYWDLAEKRHSYGSYDKDELNAYIRKFGELDSGEVESVVTNISSKVTTVTFENKTETKKDINRVTLTDKQHEEILAKVVDEARAKEEKKRKVKVASVDKIDFDGYKVAIEEITYGYNKKDISEVKKYMNNFCLYNPFYAKEYNNGNTLEQKELEKANNTKDYVLSVSIRKDESGNVCLGRNKNDSLSYDLVTCFYVNGEVYEGEMSYKVDKIYRGGCTYYKCEFIKNGKGKLILANGDIFEGEFSDNFPKGIGEYTSLINGSYKCEYKAGKFVKHNETKKDSSTRKAKKDELNTEIVKDIYEKLKEVLALRPSSNLNYKDIFFKFVCANSFIGVNSTNFDNAMKLLLQKNFLYEALYRINETLEQKEKERLTSSYYKEIGIYQLVDHNGILIARKNGNPGAISDTYGTVFYDDGSIYEGEFSKKAIYKPNSRVIEGFEIERKGKGRIISKYGKVYEGEFKKKQLKGICMYNDSLYVGTFKTDDCDYIDWYELYNGKIYERDGSVTKVKDGKKV
ncbi:MAG: hypothetical protein IKJ30_04980 [Bacilli bacterium]|nr:hypothetical protein [Bacilli bacterium]